jgi:hypothetical protein
MRAAPEPEGRLDRYARTERVIARLELSGPERFVASVHAGLDVHRDGSLAAYRGRVRREAIEPGGEDLDAIAALRRVVSQAG